MKSLVKATLNTLILAAGVSIGALGLARADDTQNQANNPVAAKWTIEPEYYHSPSYYGSHSQTSTVQAGYYLLPFKIGDFSFINRGNIPWTNEQLQLSHPGQPGTVLRMGDYLDELFLITQPTILGKKITFGFGPTFTVPTGNGDNTMHKWGFGPNFVALATFDWGLIGGLMLYQHTLPGGPKTARSHSVFAFEPFFYYNLPDGFYLRSSATMEWDFAHGTYVIPIGTGIGKTFTLKDKSVVNLWLEPQWTVAHRGSQPKMQINIGLKYQFDPPGFLSDALNQVHKATSFQ